MYKNAAIYLVISFLQKAMGFLLLPIYTSFLTPADYGVTNIVNSVCAIIVVLFNLSLHGASMRFYYQFKDNEYKVKMIWGTNIIFALVNTIIISCLIFVFHRHLVDPFTEGVQFYPFLFIGILASACSIPYLFYQTYLQADEDGERYGINNIVFFVFNTMFTILFIVIFRMSAIGVLLASLFANVLFMIYSVIKLKKKVIYRFDYDQLKKSLKYSLPLVPYNLSSLIGVLVDRLFLNSVNGIADVGLYSVGFQFANIMNVITSGVAQAYSPWFFSKHGQGEQGNKEIKKNFEFIISFFAYCGLMISYISPFLIRIMVNSSFYRAWTVVPIMVLGYSIYGIYIIVSNGLFLKKTYYLPIISFFGAAVNIVANMVLVPRMGLTGAAISSLLYNITMTGFVLFIAEKKEPIGYSIKNILLILGYTIPFYVLQLVVKEFNQSMKIVISILVILSSTCLFVLLNRERIKRLVFKYLKKDIHVSRTNK